MKCTSNALSPKMKEKGITKLRNGCIPPLYGLHLYE